MKQEEILSAMTDIYQNQMPFNRLLGIEVEEVSAENVRVKIRMREALVGNFFKGILHGGVISSVLDLTGGMVASVGILKQMDGASPEEIVTRFSKMGTIDLRVDYLRAGKGEWFIATGSVLRAGNKVAVVRMEFHNDIGQLIAAGTGTYMVG